MNTHNMFLQRNKKISDYFHLKNESTSSRNMTIHFDALNNDNTFT